MEVKNHVISKEIDLVALARKVWLRKKLLLIFTIIFAFLGVVVALNTEKRYTANVVLAPEVSGMGMSQSLGDLASMVGVDLGKNGNSMDAIYPDIYPDIFASNDFITALFPIKVTLQGDSVTKTYYDHLKYDHKIPFWNYPVFWIQSLFTPKNSTETAIGHRGINLFRLTKEQTAICNAIRTNISCLIDKKTSVISINVTDVDPQVAAVMADTIKSRLQQYITAYRTQKARNDLAYAKEIFEQAKDNYVRQRDHYSSYADANTDIVLPSYETKREELENNMQLKYNMYTQAFQQLQTAKQKVQEKTPAFTTIQSATVPLQASNTPRSTMVFIAILLGILTDSLWVLVLEAPILKYMRTAKVNV